MRSRTRTIERSLRAPHVRPHDLSIEQRKKVTDDLEVPLERSAAPLLADTDPRTIGAGMEAREAANRTLSGVALKRSVLVAVIVGTALNLINQGPEMLSGKWPVIWKLALTYVVPFLVASYGSYAAFRSSR